MKRSELLHRVDNILKNTYGTPDLGNKEDPLDELIFMSLCVRSGPDNVERAYAHLKRRFPTWNQVLQAPEGAIAECVRVSGAAMRKEERIKRILGEIQSKHETLDLRFLRHATDEEAYERLTSLPHVGPKIAHCVMMYSLGRAVLPVDTHVLRILKRVGVLSAEIDAEEASATLPEFIPEHSAHTLHVNLVVHGRRICRAYKPNCERCSIEDLCAYAGHHVLA